MDGFIRFIIRRRYLVLASLALITLAAASMFSVAVLSSSVGGLFLGEHPDYPDYLRRAKDFGNDDVLVVAVEDPRFLSAAGQERLRKATDAVAKLPHVQRVRSVLDIQHIQGTEDGIEVVSYGDLVADEPGRESQVLARLRKDRYARGLLVSNDGRSTSVVAELTSDADRPAEDMPKLVAGTIKAFRNAGYTRAQLHMVGMPANVAAVIEATRFNLMRLFPLVSLVLLGAVWVMFRRLWPVAITGLVALISVTWTMGFALIMDRNISVMVAMVPSIVLIIAFSDVVHLCSAYLLELSHGKSKEEAIRAAGSEVGAACLFTSVTTFVGFVSLSLVPTPVSRQMGLVLGLGAASALVLAVTLTPILMWLFPRPRAWREGATGKVQALLDRFLLWVAAVTSARPWTVVLIFAALVGVMAVGGYRFTIKSDFARRIHEDHDLRKDGRFFARHFAGTSAFHLYLTVPAPRTLMEPKTFARIARYQAALEKLPDVDRVTSLVDLMQTMHGALEPGAVAGALPTGRNALAQYLLLFEMSGGAELDRMVDFARRTIIVRVFLATEEFRRIGEVGRQAELVARSHLGEAVKVKATGQAYLLGEFFNVILEEQKNALMLVFAVIAVMMVIGLRSLRVGLWSMIPNLLPLFTLAGVCGLFLDYVDSDLLAIAMVAIGIGVDDTIHFLMRFRIESRRQPDVAQALKRTFTYSGRGIVITTVILVAGFIPFALSNYLSIFYFGTMLPLALVVALAADLFLVPALARLGAIRF